MSVTSCTSRTGPSGFDPGVPHKVFCVDPFQVTAEIGGRSFGPYMLTEHEVATCGMTREIRSHG